VDFDFGNIGSDQLNSNYI